MKLWVVYGKGGYEEAESFVAGIFDSNSKAEEFMAKVSNKTYNPPDDTAFWVEQRVLNRANVSETVELLDYY